MTSFARKVSKVARIAGVSAGASVLIVGVSGSSARADAASTKPGVVESCGGFWQKTWRDVSGAIASLAPKPATKSPNVVVVEDDGTLLESDDINLCGVAKVFYKNFADDRHMIFAFAQGGTGTKASGYNAYYKSVRNDVK